MLQMCEKCGWVCPPKQVHGRIEDGMFICKCGHRTNASSSRERRMAIYAYYKCQESKWQKQ